MPHEDPTRLTDAFAADGWNVISYLPRGDDSLGMVAEHTSAKVCGDPNTPKKAYYLEGSHYDMGYLLGRLAEPDIARMTHEFVHMMLWDLVAWHPRPHNSPEDRDIVRRIKDAVGDKIGDLMKDGCEKMLRDIPDEFEDELLGIYAGCLDENDRTTVTLPDLWVLNFGIDWFMANVYTLFGLTKDLGRAVRRGLAGIRPPGDCNGFALFNGAAADNGFLFGRDFMFPTGGVFERTACLMVCKPARVAEEARHPFMSLTAPGIIGAIAGVNDARVAIGVDIAPSAAAAPERPGFNSLVLNRYCLEKGGSAEEAANVIVEARRGVPWIYIIADGANDKACVVETVRYDDADIDFWKFPPGSLKRRCLFRRPCLPDRAFLRDHPTAPQRNGVMVRWADYDYDQAYLAFNERLFRRFDRTLPEGAHDEKGFINSTYADEKCPYWYYFAPQRETRANVVLTTNHFLIPEIRYTSMTPWTSLVFKALAQDSQWRYDALNELILVALEQAGPSGIDYGKAKEILQFLDPSGTYGDYYGTDKRVIDGAQSLFDLKGPTIESHYGHYADEWVGLGLKRYFPWIP